MTPTTESNVRRAAQQLLRTEVLLGVDAVPWTGTEASEKQERLAALARRYDEEIAPNVTEYQFTRSVFGEGNADARLMFVGEGPGADEDRTGRPFVGRAGKKLDDMIGAMGFAREDVYIANIVKIRPPGNRTPTPDEVDRDCAFLEAQIDIVEPDVIVALGAPATKFLLDTTSGITKLRGLWNAYEHGDRTIDVMPTFHPAYLLRNYDVETRRQVWNDLQAVITRLEHATSPRAEAAIDD